MLTISPGPAPLLPSHNNQLFRTGFPAGLPLGRSASRILRHESRACLVVMELDVVRLGATDAGAVGCHHGVGGLAQAGALLGSDQGQRIHKLLEVDLPSALRLNLQAVPRPCCSADDAQVQGIRHDPSQSRMHLHWAHKHSTADDAMLRPSRCGQAVLAHPHMRCIC